MNIVSFQDTMPWIGGGKFLDRPRRTQRVWICGSVAEFVGKKPVSSQAIPGRRGYGSGRGCQGLPRNGIQNFRVSFPEALETRNFWTLRNGDPTLTAPPSAKMRR